MLFFRLSISDSSVELKNIFVKQDLERESVDVVAVMEEQPKENEEDKDVEIEGKEAAPPKPTNQMKPSSSSRYSDESEDVSDGEPAGKRLEDRTSSPAHTDGASDQVPEEKPNKISPSSLPPFDSVKSPQPQLARDEKEAIAGKPGKIKEGRVNATPPPATANHAPSVLYNSGSSNKIHNENFNTLVDVAASMKPVSEESMFNNNTGSGGGGVVVEPAMGKDGSHKSTLAYLPPNDHGHHGNGNDSDSSGSGSLSPIKKKHRPYPAHHHRHEKTKGAPPPAPPTEGPSAKVSREEAGKLPDTPSFGSMHFPFYMLPPISPGESEERNEKEMIQQSQLSKVKSQWPPPHPPPMGKELDTRYPPNIDTSNPPTHMVVPSLVPFVGSSAVDAPPTSIAPPVNHGSVIQDKGGGKIQSSSSSRKRKNPPGGGEPGKRSATPPKPHLPPLPQSLGRPGIRADVIIQPQNMELEGFVYDPSLPMSKEYQIIAYQKEKEKQDVDHRSASPKLKRVRPDQPAVIESHTSPTSSAFRGFIPPGIIGPDHVIAHHPPPPQPQIKQEPMPRPSRPSSGSKGSASHHTHPSKQPSNQPKKYPSSARSKHPEVKLEHPENIQWAHPFVPGIINLPPGISMSSSPSTSQPSFTIPQYIHGGLQFLHPGGPPLPPVPPPGNKSIKSENPHGGGGAHRSASDIARQTPSPNPKKPHEWAGHPRPHVIAPTPTKPEHGSSSSSSGHHGNQVPNDSKHHGGGGHVRISHQNRHSVKHDSSSSSRHSMPSTSHPQPSPTHPSERLYYL